MKYYFLILILFSTPRTWAQTAYSFSGKITDSEGENLAFVAVIPNGDVSKGVLSDIEGRFSIASKTRIESLTFRAIGLQTLTLSAENLSEKKPLSIKLKKADNLISEFTFSAGENPADRLMRRVIAHRDRNNPEKLKTFQCKTYNKMTFDFVPNDSAYARFILKRDTTRNITKNQIKYYRHRDSIAKQQQSFLMETVTERRFRFPNDNFERVILNRVSGFPNMGIVALANMVQPFSFYGDFLRILDKDYVNPVSIGSPSLYFFNIEDTLYKGVDTVFLVSFHPKKGKVFEGLTGLLHVNSRHWAVQNVQAKPSNAAQSMLKIEQQYKFDTLSTQWFPDQLNFEWTLPKYPSPLVGLRITGRSYISDVSVNPPLKQRDFNPELPLIIEDSAYNQPDIAWLPYRKIAPLSMRELQTYKFLDSLAEKKHFGAWVNVFQILGSGALPLRNSGVNVDLTRLIRLNNYESIRLGLGFTTAQTRMLSRPKRWELGTYVGYGVQDSAWKYGGYAKLRLAQGSETTLQLSYANDIREPGAVSELDATGFASRSFYAKYFDSYKEISATLGSRLGKRIYAKIALQQADFKPNYAYNFVKSNGEVAKDFRFAEVATYVKYVYNEQNNVLFGEPTNEINKIPVIEIGYTRGFKNEILRGEYAYEKWIFAIHQSVLIRRLGRAIWRVEGGKVTGNVPFSKLFTLNQSGDGSTAFIALPNTFQTLKDSIWLSDKFLNVYFQQSFGNILYRSKWSSPQLSIAQKVAVGRLSNPESHQGITFQTPTKPILESGLILDNLLTLNYVNFSNIGIGGAFYYRWGNELTKENWKQVLNPRLSFKIIL
ncbi:MAG: DUF5686 family protein [Saprospiraceae bacterium]|nr:DUF5686 family protein [Saprospiraceae bacterium]